MSDKSQFSRNISFGNFFGRKDKKSSSKKNTRQDDTSEFFVQGDLNEFQAKLRGQHRTGPSIGSAHILDFAKVQQYFGDKWPSRRKKVHEYIRQAIERRLSEKDLYTLYNNQNYIIVFSQLTKEIARLKCSLISQELSKRLFGSKTSEFLDIIAADIDEEGEIHFEKISSKPNEKWTEISEKTTIEPPDEPSSLSSTSISEGDLAKNNSTDIDDANKKKKQRFQNFTKYDDVFDISFKDFISLYRPMWNTKQKVISAYCCIPARLDSNGSALIGGAAMPLGHASPENAALDHFILQRIVTDLVRMDSDRRKMFLVEPVHFITLKDPKLHAPFLELCRRIPQELRKLLIFEVLGLPDNLPSTIMTHIMSTLEPFSRAVSIRRRLDARNLGQLRDMGVNAVGADISNYTASEEKIIQQMDGFCELASTEKLSTYIHGLSSVSLISSALGAGFTYVDGDPVMSVIDLPEPFSPFNLDNLYGPLMTPEPQ